MHDKPVLIVEDDEDVRGALAVFLEGTKAVALGVDGYMTKPIEFPVLLEYLGRHC